MSALNMLGIALFFSTSVLAVDIAFMQGEACTLSALYGIRNVTAVTCYDLTQNSKNASSVDLRNFEKHQRVRFFSDSKCTTELQGVSETSCFTPLRDESIAAFTISYDVPDKRNLASADSSTDLVAEPVKLGGYSDLEYNTLSTDLRYSRATIGVSALVTASTLSFVNAVLSCKSAVSTPGPLTLFACIASIVATILSWSGVYLIRSAANNFRDHVSGTMGQVDDSNTYHNGRRSLINARNFDFMHSTMNATGSPATYSGLLMSRNFSSGEQLSPIYELAQEDGSVFHLTSFHDDASGERMFHLAPSQAVHAIEKRDTGPGYNNVRWSANGIDFSYCRYGQSYSRSVYEGKSTDQLYQTFYDELSCYFGGSSELQNSNQLLVDMYNGDRVIVGEINMAPYKDGGPVNNNAYVINQCSTRTGDYDQSCV